MEFAEHIDLQPVIDIIATRNIDYCSALQESKISIIQNISGNENKTVQISEDWGAGYYILKGTRDVFYSTNKYDHSVSEIITHAEKLGNTESWDTSPAYNMGIKSTVDILEEGPLSFNFREEINEWFTIIKNQIPNELNFRIQVEGNLNKRTLQNSSQSLIRQIQSNALLTIEIFSPSENHVYVVETLGGVDKGDFTSSNLIELTKNLVGKCHQLKDAKAISPSKYDILVHPDTSFSLIHESIGHAVEADQVISGESYLWDRMGHKIASSELTIIDDPHMRGAGWAEFDDEGVKTKGSVVVDEGVLSEFLHTLKTSRKMDTIPTGNARAANYFTPPEPRQSNLYMESGNWSNEELLEEVNSGILLGPTFSASTSIYTGDFVIHSQYGYIIEDNEVQHMVKPLTFTGQASKSLSNIVAKGDTSSKISSYCIKEDSKLLIGGLFPPMVIQDQVLN